MLEVPLPLRQVSNCNPTRLLPSALPPPRSSSTSPQKAGGLTAPGEGLIRRASSTGTKASYGESDDVCVTLNNEQDELDVISPAQTEYSNKTVETEMTLVNGSTDVKGPTKADTDGTLEVDLSPRKRNRTRTSVHNVSEIIGNMSTNADNSRRMAQADGVETNTESPKEVPNPAYHDVTHPQPHSTRHGSRSHPHNLPIPMGSWKVRTPRKRGDLFFEPEPISIPSPALVHRPIIKEVRVNKASMLDEKENVMRSVPLVNEKKGLSVSAQIVKDAKHVIQETTATAAGGRKRKAEESERTTRDGAGDQQAAVVKRKKASDEELAEYRAKYLKAFPNFVFHFDLEAEASAVRTLRFVRNLRASVTKLGGRVEEFLSKKVTHVISHKTGASGSAQSSRRQPQSATASVLAPKDVNNSARAKMNLRGPADQFKKPEMPGRATEDVSLTVQSAQSLGIKVWSLDKLSNVIDILLGAQHIPTKHSANAKTNELSFLLEDEKINGTRERDAAAPRADYYYFPQDSYHLLVEDATGDNRPIMAKQYQPPKRSNESDPWPSLHGTFLKPSETAKNHTVPVKEIRDRVWKLWVTGEGWKGEYAPSTRGMMFDDHQGGISRSLSLGNLEKWNEQKIDQKRKEDGVLPYQAASGNSVVLTSNIASTTSNTRSGGAGSTPGGGFNPGQFGNQGKDKRLVQLSKRVQLLKGKADPVVLAAERKRRSMMDELATECTTEIEHYIEDEEEMQQTQDQQREEQDASTMMEDEDNFSPVTESIEYGGALPEDPRIYQNVRRNCLRVLKEAKAPVAVPYEYKRMLKRVKSQNFAYTQHTYEPKAGYCENCRVKYEDFSSVSIFFFVVRVFHEDKFYSLTDLPFAMIFVARRWQTTPAIRQGRHQL